MLASLISARGVVLAALVLGVQATSGCASNEYRIKNDELRRLAELPPDARGASVRIGQKLGSRRADAVEAPTEPMYGYVEDVPLLPDVYVSSDVPLDVGGGGGRVARPSELAPTRPAATTAWRGTPAPSGTPASAWHGTPPSTAAHWRGSPTSSRPRPVPTSTSGGGGGGSFNFSSGGGGGGGSGGDGLAALVVVLIVGAALATVVLAASEGTLYEGHVEMAPDQVLHLEGPRPHDVALGDLTREDAASADGALVMDDEGYGFRELDHAPLDRKGGVFRFELGGGAFNFRDLRVSGFQSRIQTGYFPTSHVGVLFDLTLGTGSPDLGCCVGPVVNDSVGRYSAGLELQALPLNLGPLHLGAFAGGGEVLVGPAGARESGPIGSAGALLELDLTSHMALAVRGGVSTASLPSGWSSSGAVTGGLAIY